MITLGVFKFDKADDVCYNSRYGGDDYKIIWINEKCGLWSGNKNKPILDCRYDSISPIIVHDNYIGEYVTYFKVGICHEGKFRYGIFDIKRECFILSCEYWIEPIISLENVFGFFATNVDRLQIGVLDKDGKIICPIVFDGHLELTSFDDNTPGQERLFIVKDEDWQGRPLESLFFVLKNNTGYQVFNQRGDLLTKACYTSVRMVDTGRHYHSDYSGYTSRDIIFIVCTEDLYGVISESGKEIVPCSYDAIDYNPHMDVLTMKKNNDYSVFRINHNSLLD